MLNVVMLSVVILNVVILSVAEPIVHPIWMFFSGMIYPGKSY
jgi:hypothetical protein